MKELSVGIVGCGHIATESHLPTYRETELPVSVACVCDLNDRRAISVSKEFDVPSTYNDVSEMLDIEDLDIVDICIPPGNHTEIALEAIQSGCNVFVEKPLTLTTDESEELVQAAATNDVAIGVMHNMLYNKPFVAAKRRIAAGEIGTLTGVRMLVMHPRQEALEKSTHWYHDLPGGIMTETLPHISYLSLDLMGSITDVDVTAKRIAEVNWAQHDEFEVLFENSEVTCSTHLSYSSSSRAMRIDILGTEGYLQLDMLNNEIYSYDLSSTNYLSLGLHSLKQLGQRVWNLSDNVKDVVTGNASVGSRIVLEDFIESVLRDESPPVDGNDGRETVAVVEQVYQSYNSKYER
jgi:predicted dehydrogenase